MIKSNLILAGLIVCGFAFAPQRTIAAERLALGIKAADTAALRESYRPHLELLSSRLGQAIELKIYSTVEELGKAAKAGESSLFLLSPTDYVGLHASAGIEALATKKNKGGTPFCQGTLIAPKTNDIRSIADLKGKKFCFGAKGSFNKYYAALAAFMAEGFNYQEQLSGVVFGSDCDGIGNCILKGEADAGVVCDYSWKGWAASPKDGLATNNFIIIAQGPRLHEEVVAVPTSLKRETREQLLKALASLEGDPILLKAPLKATGFVPSTDKDYDDLRNVLKTLGNN